MRPQWELRWQDYYEILEVRFEASVDAITGAYRGLVKRYHADNTAKGDPEKIKLLNEGGRPFRKTARHQSIGAIGA